MRFAASYAQHYADHSYGSIDYSAVAGLEDEELDLLFPGSSEFDERRLGEHLTLMAWQLGQALTNIVKNATEAIAAVPLADIGRGRIVVSAAREGEHIVIDVIDNGLGLPKENRNRLLEPYVTTREKGTGLGLAIVGRILEEHGGGIELRDASDRFPGQRGAWMRMRFANESVAKPENETKS